MNALDPTGYGPIFAALLEPRLMPLGPGTPNRAARGQLDQLGDAFRHATVRDRAMADCCRAGAWLYHDFLDESHSISQEIHTPSGSFWHAIMHRREPDAWNSKYWWRRVGDHPVLARLSEAAPTLGYTYRDPFAFVDFVERVSGSGTAEEELAKQVQVLEWQLLFDHCYRQAVGG